MGQARLDWLRQFIPLENGNPADDTSGRVFSALDLHGAIVTLDAMECQRAIAQALVGKRADFVFGLKGNQGMLHDQVKHFFDVTFHEDVCRTRCDHASQNLNIVRKIAMNLLRLSPVKRSLTKKRLRDGRNPA